MKPLFHSSSFFFFSAALLTIFIINIPTYLCEDDGDYTNCNMPFYCGSDITNLKYPFWGVNRGENCGGVADPNTKLTCEDRVPKITINNVKYRILDWKDTTQKLTVARDDYSSGDVCAVNNKYQNSTFDNTQFRADTNDVANVTLLYGCNNQNLLSAFYDIDCGDSKYVVYTVVYSDQYFKFCNPTGTVVIPILKTQVAQFMSGNGIFSNMLKDSLQNGFDLNWIGNYTECQSCLETGGMCGNDGRTQFTCFCKDGPYKTSCNSEKASSSSSSMSIISLSCMFYLDTYLIFYLPTKFLHIVKFELTSLQNMN